MIEVIYAGGKFLAKGTFSLGIAGVFENKDFNDSNIQIISTLNHILKETEKEDSFMYQPLWPYLKGKGGNGEMFQFSDSWGKELFCGAYDRFDENFTSCDWHNH